MLGRGLEAFPEGIVAFEVIEQLVDQLRVQRDVLPDLLARLQTQVVLNLPEDVYATYVPKVLSLSAAEASQVASRYVQPAKFLVVVVGDRARVEAPLKALNLGPMTVLSVDEALK